MATNGSFTGSTSNKYITSKIEWGAKQNTPGNYSDVTATLFYKKSSSSTSATKGTLKCSLTINGSRETDEIPSFNIPANDTWQEAMTYTVRVPHNSDGSKSVIISCTGYISGTTLESTTCKDEIELTDIPRASSITVPTTEVGKACKISIKRASASFTHTLTYTFGSLSGTIATKTSEASITWTIPESFYSQMADLSSKVGVITCVTYNGNDELGTTSADFIVTVSNSNAPTLNPEVYVSADSDTYKLTGSTAKLIRYYTWPTYEINAESKNGATIVSQSAQNGDTVYTDAAAQMRKAIVTNKFIFSATDSRGYTTTQEYFADVVEYVRLTCLITNPVFNSGGGISFRISGNYFNGSFGAKNNTISIQYRYRTSNGEYSEWKDVTAILNSNAYYVDVTLTGLNYLETYTIQAKATDQLGSIMSKEIIFTCIPVYDWGKKDFNFNTHVKFSSTTSLFPVDSVYHTSINENPSDYLGGTWTLINRFLHPTRSSDVGAFFTQDTSAVSSVSAGAMIRQGNAIRVKLNLVLAENLTDTSATLGTLGFEYLGISSIGYTQFIVGVSDGGNGLVMCNIDNDGVITSVDVVPKVDNNSIASGQTLYLDFTIIPSQDYLLDEKCDDFVWKRTA